MSDVNVLKRSGVCRKSSTERAEKCRKAAKGRRDKESVEFINLMAELPFKKNVVAELDKGSMLRLAISYIYMKQSIQKDQQSSNGTYEVVTESAQSALNTFQRNEGKLMLEALNGFLMFVTKNGEIMYASDSIKEHLGYEPVQVIGRKITDFIHDGDEAELYKQFKVKINRMHSNGHPYKRIEVDGEEFNSHEFQLERAFYLRMKYSLLKPGSKSRQTGYMLIQWSGRLKVRPSNKPRGFTIQGLTCVCRPMQTNSILEIRLDGNMFMSRHHMDMTFTFCDPRIVTLIGYEPSEVIGRTAYQFHNPLDAFKISNCHNNLIRKGTSVSKYYRFLGKNGDWVWMQTRATIIYNTKNKPQYVVCMNYVISEEEGRRYLMLEQENSNVDPLISNVKGFADLTSCGNSLGARSLTSSSGDETDGEGFSSGYHSCNSIDSPFSNEPASPLNKNVPSPVEINDSFQNSEVFRFEKSGERVETAMCTETENSTGSGVVSDSVIEPASTLSAEQALDIIFSNSYNPDHSELNSVSGIDMLEEFFKSMDSDGEKSESLTPNFPQPVCEVRTLFNSPCYQQENNTLNLERTPSTINSRPLSGQDPAALSHSAAHVTAPTTQFSNINSIIQGPQPLQCTDSDTEMTDIEFVKNVNNTTNNNQVQSSSNSKPSSQPNRVSLLRSLLSVEMDKIDPVLPKMFNSIVSKNKEKTVESSHSTASQVTSTVMSNDMVVNESDQLLSSNDPMWKGNFESQLQNAFSKAAVSMHLSSINPTDLPTSNTDGCNSNDVDMMTSNDIATSQVLSDEFLNFALQYCDTLAEEQARSVIAGLSQDDWPVAENIESMTNETAPVILPDSSNIQKSSYNVQSKNCLTKGTHSNSNDNNVVSSTTDITESKLRAMLTNSQQQKSQFSHNSGTCHVSSHSNKVQKEQSCGKTVSSMSELEKALRGYAEPSFHFQEHECKSKKDTPPQPLPDSFGDDKPLLQKLLTGEISQETYQRIDRHMLEQQKRRMSSQG